MVTVKTQQNLKSVFLKMTTMKIFLFASLCLLNPILNGMEQATEPLSIHFSVKLANGAFATLNYNPYLDLIIQEERASDGVIRNGPKLALKNLSTGAPIKEVTPRGFVQLDNKLLAIAYATVHKTHDHALFFRVVDSAINSNFTGNFVCLNNGEIKEIGMQTRAGNLFASLLAQIGTEIVECSVPFKEHTWDIELNRVSVIKRYFDHSK